MLVESAFGILNRFGKLLHVPSLEAFLKEEAAGVGEDQLLTRLELAFLAGGGGLDP